MTPKHEDINPLEKAARKAIAAGLTTPEETAQVLTQLDLAKLPHEASGHAVPTVPAQAETKDNRATGNEPPQDEQELLEWMTDNLNAEPWVKEAKCVALNPYESVQALIQVTNQDNYIFRLGISYSQDEENESSFDEAFLE